MKAGINLKKIHQDILLFLSNLASKQKGKENKDFWKFQLTASFSQHPKNQIDEMIEVMREEYTDSEKQPNDYADATTAAYFMMLIENRYQSDIPAELPDNIEILQNSLYYPSRVLQKRLYTEKPQHFYFNSKTKEYDIYFGETNITPLLQMMTRVLLMDFLITQHNHIAKYIKDNPKDIEHLPILKSFTEEWLKNQLNLIKKVLQPFSPALLYEFNPSSLSRQNFSKKLFLNFLLFVKAPSQHPKSLSLLGGALVGVMLFMASWPLSPILGYAAVASLSAFTVIQIRNSKLKHVKERYESTKTYSSSNKTATDLAYEDGLRAGKGYFEYFKCFARPRDWKNYDRFAAGMQTSLEVEVEARNRNK